jgi:hypothetical protein
MLCVAVFQLLRGPAALVGIFLLRRSMFNAGQLTDRPMRSMQAKKRAVRNLDKGSGVINKPQTGLRSCILISAAAIAL